MNDDNRKLSAGVPSSPCVRNCCLDEQDVCLGCFRHLDEIIGWQGCSNAEKKAIQRKSEKRRQVCLDKTSDQSRISG